MKKLFIPIILIIILILSSCTPQESELSVEILKIGKADAILFKTPLHTILMDTGEEDDAAEICDNLSDLGVTSLDLLIITHYDKDHLGSAAEIIKKFEVKEIIEPGYEKDSKLYLRYRSAAEGIPCTVPDSAVTYQFGEATFTIHPPKRAYANENDASLVTMVECLGCKMLFTGDILSERVDDLLSEGVDLSAEFLKIPHHGSMEDNSAELIRAVSPECAAITCSDKNPADEELLALLEASECDVFETRYGNISIMIQPDGAVVLSQ